jgi:DNA-damage-inducible protein D
MSDLNAEEYKSFENIKKKRADGTEFWSARELSKVLQYNKWENFSKVIDRAKLACKNSGGDVDSDFPEVRKIVKAGALQKKITDYELSRYACYLIVQNGDPRKEVIALRTNIFCNSNKKTRSC